MMGALYKLFFYLSVLVSMPVFSQTSTPEAFGKVYESVWAWKLTTPLRDVYLLGEQHRFLVPKNVQISHSLGTQILAATNPLLCENSSRFIDPNPKQLKQRVSPETWLLLKEAIKAALNKSTEHTPESPALLRAVDAELVKLNSQTYYNLMQVYPGWARSLINRTDIAKILAENVKAVPGFIAEHGSKRCVYMESADFKNYLNPGCEVNDARYEKLIMSHLPEFHKEPHAPFDWQDLKSDSYETEFMRTYADTDSLEKVHNSLPDNDVFEQCNIKPRDERWMEIIKPQLTTKGPPLVIAAGSGHIVGQYGLLNMLCQAGYCGAKRIFKLEQ